MANKTKRGTSKDSYVKTYDYPAQRKKHLERQLKLQPNNKQVKEALKNIKPQMQRSHNKGGWIDKSKFPWNQLSKAVQRLPMEDAAGDDTVNQYDLIFDSTMTDKMAYAKECSLERKRRRAFSEKNYRKMMSESKLGYANQNR